MNATIVLVIESMPDIKAVRAYRPVHERLRDQIVVVDLDISKQTPELTQVLLI